MLAILDNPNLPKILLRAGLAFVFAYAAMSSLLSPDDWIGYMAGFIIERLDREQIGLMLKVHSVFEILLAVWLLSGIRTFWAALAAAAALLVVVLVTSSQLIITFRDVGLLAASLALAAMTKSNNKKAANL